VSIQEEDDAIVIGSGEACKSVCWRLASKGQRVASVKDKQLGGAYPNVAGLPAQQEHHPLRHGRFVRSTRIDSQKLQTERPLT
jgi:pyruvate/2-oxoglutarate dehydrogenase complex dihydrolipoamide dehydrogenase (E3) component